jgi:AraC-like DNA-binding protein
VTIGIVAVWSVALGLWLLEIGGLPVYGLQATLTPLAVAVLVYALGYLGLRQPEIFHHDRERLAREPAAAGEDGDASTPPPTPTVRFEPPPAAAISAATTQASGYEKSGLTQTQAEGYLERLIRLMEEKQPFRRSELTLQELAAELRITSHNLSQVINTQLGKNFHDFVNGYRVEEVKRRLRDPGSGHLTILTIAFDAGFNTKSTFNAFFRKHTGLTPSQYRARQNVGA